MAVLKAEYSCDSSIPDVQTTSCHPVLRLKSLQLKQLQDGTLDSWIATYADAIAPNLPIT